jgi:hypothetical protein
MRRHRARSRCHDVQRRSYAWLLAVLGLGLASVLARNLRRLRPRQQEDMQPSTESTDTAISDPKLRNPAADAFPAPPESSQVGNSDEPPDEQEVSRAPRRLVGSLLPPYGKRRRQQQQHAAYLASFRRYQDVKSNAESTPPPGERIELHSLWLAEAYSPSTVMNLLNGLRRLGWASDLSQSLGEVNLARWVASSRAAAYGGSWANIGTIVNPGDTRFLGTTREALLPEGVDYARGTVSTLTPSLTVLVIQFVFTDQVAQDFDTPMRRSYETYARKQGPRFTAYITPGSQKQDAMLASRRAIRDHCGYWFRSNLPGVFSSGLIETGLPSCEFITTRLTKPFEREPSWSWDHYMRRLGLEGDWDTWRSDELPGLGLRLPRGAEDDAFALLLAGRFDDIFVDDDMQFWGGRTRGGFTARLDDYIDRTIAAWAARAALIGYQQRLTEMRDRASLPEGKTKAAIRALDSVRKELLLTTADAQRVGRDLAAMAEEKRLYSHSFETDFEPAAASRREFEPSLIELMREDTLSRARTLSETEQHVREVLLASSNLASTTANLRLQRRITALTWILLILAILALAVPVYQFIHADAERNRPPPATVTTRSLK